MTTNQTDPTTVDQPEGPGSDAHQAIPDWATGAGAPVLERPYEGRMLAGVAAGVARYLAVDVSVVRIALVVLTFVGGISVPAYLAGWLLIPEEGSDRSLAEEWVEHRHGFA